MKRKDELCFVGISEKRGNHRQGFFLLFQGQVDNNPSLEIT